jgi:hypothetical protein
VIDNPFGYPLTVFVTAGSQLSPSSIQSFAGVEEGFADGRATTFLPAGYLATGFFTTALAAGFLGAEKEGAGISNVNESANTRYFFIMPFGRFLLSYRLGSKGSILSFYSW